MRGRIFILLSAVTLFFAFVRVSPAEPQGEECGPPAVKIDRASGWGRENAFRGRGTATNLKDALLFAADVTFYTRCGEDRLETIVVKEIAWTVDTTIPTNTWSNVRLVLDENYNLKADPGEKVLPLEVVGNKLRVKNLNYPVKYLKRKNLLLFADFPAVREKDKVVVKVSDATEIKVEPVEVPLNVIFVYVMAGEVMHYRGNRPPELYYRSDPPFTNKYAVFPRVGSPQEEFEFSVVYRDADGDKPSAAEVWIDENGNGQFEPQERFAMADLHPDLNYRELHTFRFKRSFPNMQRRSLKFKFNFADADTAAQKDASQAVGNGIDNTQIFELEFNQDVVLKVGEIRTSGYLPSEIIALKVFVLVNYQAAIEFDWASFLKGLQVAPFGVRGFSVSPRKIYDSLYDMEEVTIFLEAPAVERETSFSLSPSALGFVAKFDGRKGKVAFPSFAVSVTLQPRIEGPFVDRTEVHIGEPIIYRLRSVRLKSAPRPEELENLTFKPFQVVQREVKSASVNALVIEDYIFTLALFEVQGDWRIPAFKFPFWSTPEIRVKLAPSKGEATLALPYEEKSLRFIPEPLWPRAGLILFVGSGFLLFLLARRPMYAGLRRLKGFKARRSAYEELTLAYQGMRGSLATAMANPARENLLLLYQAFRCYFGVIIAPLNPAPLAGDARTLQKVLAGAVAASLLDAFVAYEDFLMRSRHEESEAHELLVCLDQASLAMYDLLN